LIEISVVDNVSPQLEIMVERMGDYTHPLTTILEDGLFTAQQQVQEGKGGAFGGSAWPHMAEATIKKGRDPGTLLVETGGLLLSMSRGAAGNLFEVTPTEGSAGTQLESSRNGFPYPAAQQAGTSSYPARFFLAWYEERFPDYDLVFLDWIFANEEA